MREIFEAKIRTIKTDINNVKKQGNNLSSSTIKEVIKRLTVKLDKFENNTIYTIHQYVILNQS